MTDAAIRLPHVTALEIVVVGRVDRRAPPRSDNILSVFQKVDTVTALSRRGRRRIAMLASCSSARLS